MLQCVRVRLSSFLLALLNHFPFFSALSVVAIFIFLVPCSPSEGFEPRDRSVYGCHDAALACLR